MILGPQRAPGDPEPKADSVLSSLFLTPSSPVATLEGSERQARPVPGQVGQCYTCPWHLVGPATATGQDRSPPQGEAYLEGGRGKCPGQCLDARGSTGLQALCPEDAKHVKLASMERAEVLGEAVMSWCPGVGGKRREGEGMRARTQAIRLTGKGRLSAWQGRGKGSVLTALPLPTSYPRAGL